MFKPLTTALLAGTLLAGPTLMPAAAANQMEPGLWRFSQSTAAGKGAARQRTQTRCVTPADAANPVMFFAPRATGATCAITSQSASGSQINTKVRCTAGADVTDADISITIDTPQHMTIASTLARGSQSVQMRGEGQYVGACGGRTRKKR